MPGGGRLAGPCAELPTAAAHVACRGSRPKGVAALVVGAEGRGLARWSRGRYWPGGAGVLLGPGQVEPRQVEPRQVEVEPRQVEALDLNTQY